MKTRGLFGSKGVSIERREMELGEIGSNEVLVKVHACGVCGTDIHFLTQVETPQALGHEIAAEVVETGKNVKDLYPGNRVIVEDVTMCGVCEQCKNGRADLCRNLYTMNGFPGMGEYIRLHRNSLVPFEGLDYVHACLTEPLAVSLNAVLAAEIPFGGSVLVQGCGPIGLMAIRMAKVSGAGRVFASARSLHNPRGRARAELAKKMGADHVIDGSREDLAALLLTQLPGGADRVIVTSPPESIYDAIKSVSYGGIIVHLGLHLGGQSKITLDMNELIFSKITLRPFLGEPAMRFNVALDLIKRHVVPAEEFITHTFVMQDAETFLPYMLSGEADVIKAVCLPFVKVST